MGDLYHNLSTFEEAVRVHDSIRPVKGREVLRARPLDNGTNRFKSNVYIYRPNDGEVQVRHYSSPIAVFHSSGRIVASTMQSATTRGYVNSMLRPYGRVRRAHDEEVFNHVSGAFKLRGSDPFTLLPDGSVALNSVATVNHYSVDRKKANAVRKDSVYAEAWTRFFTKLRVYGVQEFFAAWRRDNKGRTTAHPNYHMQRMFRGDVSLKETMGFLFYWSACSTNINLSTCESFAEWMHPHYWYPVYKHVGAYRKQRLGYGPFNTATLTAALRSAQAYHNLPTA